MKILKFKEPILFEVLAISVLPNICHLSGRFLTGNFRNERRIRVEVDDRWWGAKNHIIELPGRELREVGSACGHMGRRNSYRPIYTGKLYISPVVGIGFGFFRFDDIRVVSHIGR